MLIRNRALELPVFPRWTRVAWTKEQMRARADSGTERFVRPIILRVAGATSLRSALELTDNTLDRVAEHAGIGVVEHTWGLCRRQPPRHIREVNSWRYRTEPDDIVPKGYYLVAQVANIAPLVDPEPERREEIIAKLNDFDYNPIIPGPKLRDMSIGQVGFHEVQVEGGAVIRADIMDIDATLTQL